MDYLRFYVLFNSISVISGRCLDDNERLCAMELCLWLKACNTYGLEARKRYGSEANQGFLIAKISLPSL